MLINGGRVSISDCKYEINAATRAGGAVSITKGSLEMVASSVISNYAGEADGMHCPCMRARVHTLSHTCVCVCVWCVCVWCVCVCGVCVCVLRMPVRCKRVDAARTPAARVRTVFASADAHTRTSTRVARTQAECL